MIPLKITVCDPEGLKHASDILGRAVERKANIAIWGRVGTGKTTLLQKTVEAAKLSNEKVVWYNFDSIVSDTQEKPEYVIVDHPVSLDILERAKQEHPDVPLLAVLYKEPENGFDVVVEMDICPLDLRKKPSEMIYRFSMLKNIQEESVIIIDPKPDRQQGQRTRMCYN